MAALGFLTALAAAAITYLQVTVPIKDTRLAHPDAVYHWRVAVVSTLVAFIAAVAICWLSVRAWRRR
jgi:hypothetical protein